MMKQEKTEKRGNFQRAQYTFWTISISIEYLFCHFGNGLVGNLTFHLHFFYSSLELLCFGLVKL